MHPPPALENIPFINLYAVFFFFFLRNQRIHAWYVEELIMVPVEGTWEPSDIFFPFRDYVRVACLYLFFEFIKLFVFHVSNLSMCPF